jgi:hypothetical protein
MLMVLQVKEHQARTIHAEINVRSRKPTTKYSPKSSAITVSIKNLQDSKKQKNQHVSMRRNVSSRSILRV